MWPLLIGGAALLMVLSRRTTATPGALESPGGGRIQDKRDPPPEMLEDVGGIAVHRAAAAAWRAMRAAYQADTGDTRRLGIVSGYRSSAHQARLFASAVARYGSEAEARKWVAPPGKSAHQSGRAVDLDIDGGPNSSGHAAAQRSAPAFLWLQSNAERFGFYPYDREPWHWEYNPRA